MVEEAATAKCSLQEDSIDPKRRWEKIVVKRGLGEFLGFTVCKVTLRVVCDE